MDSFTIYSNHFLTEDIQAYYHQFYTTFGTEGNPDFLNYIKNQFGKDSSTLLQNSEQELAKVLKEDLIEIKRICGNTVLTVCVVPRSKREGYYTDNQKRFRRTVSDVVDTIEGYVNGTSYIIRHTNTRTTHMDKSGYGGDGSLPYVGITKETCIVSDEVRGKNILLIDDIYTIGVNIDEDAIQALLDNGAESVIFYAVGKTYKG